MAISLASKAESYLLRNTTWRISRVAWRWRWRSAGWWLQYLWRNDERRENAAEEMNIAYQLAYFSS
jgi:hypothetical protein